MERWSQSLGSHNFFYYFLCLSFSASVKGRGLHLFAFTSDPSFFLFMAFNSELEWILWVLMRTSSALTGHIRPHESKHIGQLFARDVFFPPLLVLWLPRGGGGCCHALHVLFKWLYPGCDLWYLVFCNIMTWGLRTCFVQLWWQQQVHARLLPVNK